MIRLFLESDRQAVKELWSQCSLVVAHNDPDEDITRSQSYTNAELFIYEENGKVVGSVFVSHDARRGLIYYLAVDPSHQGNGYGNKLLDQAESWIKQQGINKVHLFVRGTNLTTKDYYKALNYKQSSTVLMEKWI